MMAADQRTMVAEQLASLHEKCFTSDAQVLLVMAKPGNPDCWFVVGDLPRAEAVRVIEKAIASREVSG